MLIALNLEAMRVWLIKDVLDYSNLIDQTYNHSLLIEALIGAVYFWAEESQDIANRYKPLALLNLIDEKKKDLKSDLNYRIKNDFWLCKQKM